MSKYFSPFVPTLATVLGFTTASCATRYEMASCSLKVSFPCSWAMLSVSSCASCVFSLVKCCLYFCSLFNWIDWFLFWRFTYYLFTIFVLNVCTCTVWVYVHQVCVGVRGFLNRVSDHLEIELKVVVNCLMWVLGTKPESSAIVVSALNQWTMSLALIILFLIILCKF